MKNIFYTFIIISLFSCQEFVNQKKEMDRLQLVKEKLPRISQKLKPAKQLLLKLNKPKITVLKLKRTLIYKIMLKQQFQMVF